MPTPFGTESCSGCRTQLRAPRLLKEIDQVVVLASVTPGRYFQFSSVEEQEISGGDEPAFRALGALRPQQRAEFPKGSLHRIEDTHLFRPIRNHTLSEISCWYFSIFICISKKIFRQPSMFCLSHDLQGKKQNTTTTKNKASIYYPEQKCCLMGLTYAIHRLIQSMNCHTALVGRDAALHNEGRALQGQFCSQGFPASVRRAGVCLQCQLHWPLQTLSLKKTGQLWSVAGSFENVKTKLNIHTLAGIPAFRFLSIV